MHPPVQYILFPPHRPQSFLPIVYRLSNFRAHTQILRFWACVSEDSTTSKKERTERQCAQRARVSRRERYMIAPITTEYPVKLLWISPFAISWDQAKKTSIVRRGRKWMDYDVQTHHAGLLMHGPLARRSLSCLICIFPFPPICFCGTTSLKFHQLYDSAVE